MTHECGRRAGRSAIRVAGPVLLAGVLAILLSGTTALAEGSTEWTEDGVAVEVETPRHATPDLTETDWRASATTITLSSAPLLEAGAANARQLLSCLPEGAGGRREQLRRLVALPECDGAYVSEVTLVTESGTVRVSDAGRLAWVEEIARIRDQTVAVVAIDTRALEAEPPGWSGEVRITVAPDRPRGPVSRNAGPFTRACSLSLMNYDLSADEVRVWTPPAGAGRSGRGSATHCASVADCAEAEIDILLVVADALHYSPFLQVYANHHASYLGLNVGIVGTSALSSLTADALHTFIQDVYETQSAANFGDGHLGFVVLVGDAFADDNETVMIPKYDGYGGTEVASDHYYACVSGDDDFEDVMLGRVSVGNTFELLSVTNKTINYAPLPSGENWCSSALLVAGLFYTIKDDYVTLFDEYEEMMPDHWTVDRIYRHDYTESGPCALDVVEEFNEGHALVTYAGDGWISSWYHTLETTHIPLMTNSDRLPIVLSMACMSGWFDNTTEVDMAGSYDCFAEQIVNAPAGGAVACLAAPRASDGGMFRTLTKKIYQAMFGESCVFVGETMAVAKLLHLQDGGDLEYARHFNLFGDPALLYRWETPPDSAPELTTRPHETALSPGFPAIGDDLSVDVTVRNLSSVSASDVLVRITDTTSVGSDSHDLPIPTMDDWSSETVATVFANLTGGWHTISVEVDPDGSIAEIDENNNIFTREIYVYPHVQGFPTSDSSEPYGPCASWLDTDGTHIVMLENEAKVRAIDAQGQTAWVSPAATDPAAYGPEITPAIGDLDGDGVNEVVATRRMGLAAFGPDGQELWSIITDDPVGAPVLADADADGDLDVILATKMFFGGSSNIVAYDEDGSGLWMYALPSGDPASATPVVGDFDQDGVADFAYGTQSGLVGAASCTAVPPEDLWEPIQLGAEPITGLGLADLDDDGMLELAATGEEAYSRNAEDGSEDWTSPLASDAVALALGDVNANGVPEMLVGCSDGSLVLLEGGSQLWSVPLGASSCGSAAIADLQGDLEMELLVVSEDGFLHMLNSDGDWIMDPIPVPGASCSPFVADLTGDGANEACVSSSDGHVFAFNFDQGPSHVAIEWSGPGGNAAHTGVLVQPFSGSFAQSAVLQGRYSITGDVAVESGATLSILPGTVLEFDSGVSPKLEVYGELRAEGRPDEEIVMTSEPERDVGSWDGLRLKPGSSATLTSCVVSAADVCVSGTQADVTLTGCDMSIATYGARLINCTLEAIDCAFALCDSSGMHLEQGGGTIEGCLFDGNYLSGLTLKSYASHQVSRSTFSNTTFGDGLRTLRYADASIDSCTSSANANHGMLVKSSRPDITGCVVTGNAKTGIHCIKLSDPIVTWCTITGNRIGVKAESGALPNLGNSMNPVAGCNSIMGNQVAAVSNLSETDHPLDSRGNWWGSYPPNGRIFQGYVRYTPCLTEPPSPGRLTLADPEHDEFVPSCFRLGANAPNPFNPVTSIEFDVPEHGGSLDIAVFDVAGRRVATLYSGHHEPGTHRVTWSGRDDRDRPVASGIYFVRLEAADFRSSRKMILLK